MKRQLRRKNNDSANKEIAHITYGFVIIFIALICYFFYFMYFESSDFINNSYNTRYELLQKKVERGSILSRDGEILARGANEHVTNEEREYPYNNLFAHAVGYNKKGFMGIEAIANFKLLTSNIFVGDRIKNDIEGIKNPGDTVITTYDVSLQKAAYDAIGDMRGAVVVMDVTTGEILALVSKPDFNPNTVLEDWDELNASGEGALTNRATSGLYPPGSTFKIVTALEFMKEYDEFEDYEFDCSGSFEYEGNIINCYHGQSHGSLDFAGSFAKSCNSSFANITSVLNRRSFSKTCKELMFDSELPVPFSYKESSVPINSDSDISDLLQTGIGQGEVLVTPMHMLLITAAIANDGVLMKPYAISSIVNTDEQLVEKNKPEEYKRLVEEKYAKELQSLMREVVVSGTASKLKNSEGYEACGKTGSAEFSNDSSKSHAWFTGFAPYDAPRLAVTVVLEGEGSGGEIAVPVAKAVFDEYFH